MNLKDKNNEYILNIINELSVNNTLELINYAEEIYFNQVNKAAENSEHSRIILVSGPSASGKTTTSEKLKEVYIKKGHNAIVISLDDFYKERRDLPIINGKPNPEVIEALEVDMIHQTFESILKTGKAHLPSYDFIKGNRIDMHREIDVTGGGILIVEGIHALNPLIHHDLDPKMVYKIYLSPHSGFVYDNEQILTKRDTRFIRRLVRDYRSRGSSAENTFYMWKEVCNSEDKFIRPLAAIADFRIDTTHAYEPCILKEQAQAILKDIKEDSIYNTKAKEILSSLSKVQTMDIEYLRKSSLLYEFLS